MRRLIPMATRMVLFSTALSWVGCAVPTVAAETFQLAVSSEIRVTPGPFAALPGAEIGRPVMFENDIDGGPCFPLQVGGRILLWIERAHRAGSHLYVAPCDQYDTTSAVTHGSVYGGVSRWWFEATPVDWKTSPRLELRRLDPPGWNLFSSPAFCGQRVAYWAFDRDSAGQDTELTPRVTDVVTGSSLASLALGRVILETDNRGCLPSPTWDDACTTVVFEAAAQGKGPVRLHVR